MVLKSILIAFRQLRKNPTTGVFNIVGLALGISTFTLLLFYIQKETSYDQYHRQPAHLHRLVNNYRIENDHNTTAWVAPAIATNIDKQVAGIGEVVRMFRYRSPVVMVDRATNKNFTEPNSIWTDANVFRVFDFDFVNGDPDQALTRPNTMVITESMARKYFATTDVIGKVLSDITMNADFEITAVVADMPETSHFKADFICALSTLPSLWGANILNDWGNSFLYTYVRISDGASTESIANGINEIASKHIPASEQYSAKFSLQPVTDIHLRSNVLNEWQPNSDIRYIYILTVVAILVLLVSVVNYINLWIARSEQRTKEIGIRQAIGGSKIDLGMQFTIESLTHVVIAIAISISLTGLAMPLVKQWLGEEVLLSQSSQTATWIYIALGVTIFMFVVMLYPARIISRIKPALAIKGRQTSRSGITIWEGLIAFQVLVTACLITGTLLINKQVNFIQQQPLGYDVDHLINISQVSNTVFRDRLKEALLQNKDVKSASGVSHLVGGTLYQSGYEINNDGKKETVLWQRMHTDHDFCETYGIPIVAGRDFSRNMASDSSNFLINETAARLLGHSDPADAVGLEVNGGPAATGKIIGVMKDFHFKTLHTAIEPLIVHIVPDRVRMLTVSIDSEDAFATIQEIEKTWKKLQPEEPFVYSTLSGFNAQNYRFEEKFGKVIVFFTVIVFLLSVSGLVSLNIYIANLRRREIGIRKILGAATSTVLLTLTRRFVVIAIIGFLFSIPLSWYALTAWLNGFAYRIELTPAIFVIGGITTVVLSMLSIMLPSLRAARENVVDVLKSGD